MAVIALMMTLSASAQFYIYCSDGNVIKVDSISMIAPADAEDPTNPNNPSTPSQGIGVFSVSATKQVTFSPGNLQYHPANNEWRFAEHQWDYVGGSNEGNVYEDGVKSNNALISPSYDGWIDLFGWGTGDNPTNSSMFNTDFVSFVDWGINKIGNDAPNTWRTLTNEEWSYLRYNRTNADDLVAVAKVNGVNGLIILPDNWVCPNNITFKPGFSYNDSNAAYGDYQVFTLEEWLEMESNGALFLPATGYGGDEIQSVQGSGAYWSSTEHDAASVYYLYFYSFESHTRYADRYWGNSVRLAKDLQ